MGERGRGIGGAGGAFQGRGGRKPQGQTVWVLDQPTKKLRAVQIRTGITDGRFTEVTGGDLKEGDNVIVGLATSKVEGPPPPGSSNPMGGRGGGGGRGGR
jgi:HlyD family secretion protein